MALTEAHVAKDAGVLLEKACHTQNLVVGRLQFLIYVFTALDSLEGADTCGLAGILEDIVEQINSSICATSEAARLQEKSRLEVRHG